MSIRRIWRFLRTRLTGGVVLPPHITLGKRVLLGRGVRLDHAHGHLITIEDDVIIATGTRILAHDAAGTRRTGMTWVAPVRVCKRAFVGADSILLPGVTIGEDAVVAAGSVVARDVPAQTVVAGVPARRIGTIAEFDRKRIASKRPVFDRRLYNKWPIPPERLTELDKAASGGGYFFGPASSPSISDSHSGSQDDAGE
jgi:acetyltransferase-like isoleucine patch superfamily enzyme